MRFRSCRSALALALLLAACVGASAQTALTPRPAELAVPFGSARGQLALAGDQLVFVSETAPDASLVIARADIRSLDRSGDTVTVTTLRRLQDRDGGRDTFRFRLDAASEVQAWYRSGPQPAPAATGAAAAAGASTASDVLASFQVKHDHRIGSCQGRLILLEDKLAFESIDEIDDSRQWALEDIKEVEQSGAYKLRVEPFTGPTFNFELIGQGMDSGVYRRLVDRIAQARSRR